MAQTGKVLWFDSGRGFGFIAPRRGTSDIFVHYSKICMEGYKKLDQGDIVEFDVEEGPKGKPQAVNVVFVRKAGE